MAGNPCSFGVLAFGDSITNGGGELQWGVALQSWALWTARGLGLPYSGYAADGATVEHVLDTQMPRFLATSQHPDGPYDLGLLYIGVNDVRAYEWDAQGFATAFARALDFLTQRCERVLTLTAPRDLGRPRAVPKVDELNAAIESRARACGAVVLDLSRFGARNHVMTDHVHPTAFGQIAIAERALAVLAADGMAVRVEPASLVAYEPTWRRRLRSDLTYVYRHTKVSARSGWLLARARRRHASP